MFYRKILALLGFVILANVWFFHTIGNLGIGLFLALVFGLVTVAHPWKREMLILAGGVLGSIFMLGWRANFDVRSVFLLVTVGMVGSVVYIATTKRAADWSLSELLMLPLASVKKYWAGLVATLPQFKQELKVPMPWSIGRGLVLAIPIVYMLVWLLSKADPIFAKQVSSLFSWFAGAGNLKTRIILSVIIAAVATPLLFIPTGQEGSLQSILKRIYRLSLVKEFTVVMGLVAVVIGAFLVIEWPYIFASVPKETELQQFGINTYSEYVQEGFTWFLISTIFIFGLVWLGLLMRAKRVAQIAVLGGFFVFLISIFRRIWLYQAYHGMTLVRAYGGFFVLAIAFFTVTLFLRHVWHKSWVYLEMVWLAVLLMILGVVNVENYIATVSPPTVNGRVDYVYLSRMSADGYRGWLKAYSYIEETLNNKDTSSREIAYSGMSLRQLLRRYDELVMRYGTPEEKEEYLLTAIAYEQERVTETQKVIPPALDRLKTDPNAEARKAETRVNQFSLRLQQYQDLLTKGPGKIALIFDLQFKATPYISFEDADCQSWGICPNSFFSFIEVKEYSLKDNQLNQLFTYSHSKQKAYKAMSSDMFNSLLELQKTFFFLYKNLAQTVGESKNYEHDISLNAPFLQPL